MMDRIKLLADARELTPGRMTGIGRVLSGLIQALAGSHLVAELGLAVFDGGPDSDELNNCKKIRFIRLPRNFVNSEKRLSHLTRQNFQLFLSPYPKLPLFGSFCPSINMIHDILDLLHPAYRRRLRGRFDRYRVKSALKRADLTWYDSKSSLQQTEALFGYSGGRPRVRYPGICQRFSPRQGNDGDILGQYHLERGYILIMGNGRPHKNLGILLELSRQLKRKLVFTGVPQQNMTYWRAKVPHATASWIPHVAERDIAAVIRGAFCLAQPSTAEGYGYPPLEAMACGIPTVVSNIPVLTETTGNTALTADFDKPQAWLESFAALENNDFYAAQVEKGLKWVEPMRGPKGWAKHIADILEVVGSYSDSN
ncbi:MAG: glycosyltransferase family 1 protein [Desulfobacterales bacterium]|jgi:glycosyltransferase involved in cell wall biosynthesis